MATKILIPTPLRPFTDKLDTVEIDGTNIGELLNNLTTKYGGLKQHLYSADGKLRSFVNIYVNDDDIRYLQKEQTPLKSGDTVSIIPSVAGGAPAATEALPELSGDEIKRYSRHLIMPEVGVEGQRKLLDARVLCIGAGGLGSPAALYLAAAGVGTLGLVDMDTVDLSNLQRQILHTNDRIGMPKTESARMTINALNPDVKVVEFRERLSSENAMQIFSQFDVIVNGCDNFPTRYLANDACVMLKKPLVDGAIWQFEGQATVFNPPAGPCYRCLFPEPPPPGAVPSCAEAGVLGVLPGLVGCVQALETIKLILGAGR